MPAPTDQLLRALRRFKPLGIGLKVVATEEKRKVRIFQRILFFVDFYAIYDICRLFHNGWGVKTVVF